MTHERVPADRYPWWVKICLIGGRSRAAQWLYAGLSIVAAGICGLLLAVADPRPTTAALLAFGGVGFIVSAVWYLLTILWIDRHGSWG